MDLGGKTIILMPYFVNTMITASLLLLSINIRYFSYAQENNLTSVNYVLPSGYNKIATPIVNGGAVHIYVKITVMDIEDIDESSMDFTLHIYMIEMWKDPRLKLEFYAECSRKEKVQLPLPDEIVEKIWKPDIIFENAKDGSLFQLTVPNTRTKVTANEELTRNSKYKVKVSCQMHLHLYPMDTQRCFLKMALFSYPDRKAQLHWISDEGSPYKLRHSKSIVFQTELQTLKYIIMLPKAYKETEVWDDGRFTYLYANFTFQRRISGSIVVVYIPSTLVVMLSWMSFWLDVQAAPARMTLGVTTLLTLATQASQARNSLPEINYMTALDVWLFACIITVFCSIIEYAVSYTAFKNAKNQTERIAKVEQMSSADQKVFQKRQEQEKPRSVLTDVFYCWLQPKSIKSSNKENTSQPLSTPFNLDNFCRIFFPFAFFSFVILYWIIYLSKHTD